MTLFSYWVVQPKTQLTSGARPSPGLSSKVADVRGCLSYTQSSLQPSCMYKLLPGLPVPPRAQRTPETSWQRMHIYRLDANVKTGYPITSCVCYLGHHKCFCSCEVPAKLSISCLMASRLDGEAHLGSSLQKSSHVASATSIAMAGTRVLDPPPARGMQLDSLHFKP